MKKKSGHESEMRAEYDFSGGVRGKYAEQLAPKFERALRAAWNKGLADQHRFPVSSDNGVTAGLAAMVEESGPELS